LKSGFADYMLFVEKHMVGVVEAKPEGTTLSGVSEQTEVSSEFSSERSSLWRCSAFCL